MDTTSHISASEWPPGRIQHMVKDLLFVQSMLRGSPEARAVAFDYPFKETLVFDDFSFPKLHFVENKYAGDETNWWIPNNAGLEAMLRASGFSILNHREREVYLCKPALIPEKPWSLASLPHGRLDSYEKDSFGECA